MTCPEVGDPRTPESPPSAVHTDSTGAVTGKVAARAWTATGPVAASGAAVCEAAGSAARWEDDPSPTTSDGDAEGRDPADEGGTDAGAADGDEDATGAEPAGTEDAEGEVAGAGEDGASEAGEDEAVTGADEVGEADAEPDAPPEGPSDGAPHATVAVHSVSPMVSAAVVCRTLPFTIPPLLFTVLPSIRWSQLTRRRVTRGQEPRSRRRARHISSDPDEEPDRSDAALLLPGLVRGVVGRRLAGGDAHAQTPSPGA